MRYNRTNFVSARVVTGIITAMQAVIASGLPQYLEDRKGERWLRVALKYIDGRLSFEFFARNNQEVGDVILSASFDWHAEDLTEFSQQLVKVYTMTEHPATVHRPTVPQEVPKAAVKVPSGLASWRSPTGITLYGKWERKWFRKRFLVTHDRQGNELRVPYHLDNESVMYGTFQGITA